MSAVTSYLLVMDIYTRDEPVDRSTDYRMMAQNVKGFASLSEPSAVMLISRMGPQLRCLISPMGPLL